MAHADKLTEEEYARLRSNMNFEVVRYLEKCRTELGLTKEQIRILDWGCGRGPWISHLLELGYREIKGVDISPNVIERGRTFFSERGYDIDQYCSTLDSTGKCNFADGSFDFIFSTQVFEHVDDLHTVAKELSRVTAVGGMGFHVYPAHKHLPVETHLSMPLIHWLPKNSLRKLLVHFWTMIGIEPRWQKIDSYSRQEKAEVYYRFSADETFYRRYDEVISVLSECGFQVCLVSIDHPLFMGQNARLRMLRAWPLKGLANWVVLNFKTVEVLTTRQN